MCSWESAPTHCSYFRAIANRPMHEAYRHCICWVSHDIFPSLVSSKYLLDNQGTEVNALKLIKKKHKKSLEDLRFNFRLWIDISGLMANNLLWENTGVKANFWSLKSNILWSLCAGQDYSGWSYEYFILSPVWWSRLIFKCVEVERHNQPVLGQVAKTGSFEKIPPQPTLKCI